MNTFLYYKKILQLINNNNNMNNKFTTIPNTHNFFNSNFSNRLNFYRLSKLRKIGITEGFPSDNYVNQKSTKP